MKNLKDIVVGLADKISEVKHKKDETGQFVLIDEAILSEVLLDKNQEEYAKILKLLEKVRLIDENKYLRPTLYETYKLCRLGHFNGISVSSKLDFPKEIPVLGFVNDRLIIEPVSKTKYAYSYIQNNEIKYGLTDLVSQEKYFGKSKTPKIEYFLYIGGQEISIPDEPHQADLDAIAGYDLSSLEGELQNKMDTKDLWSEVNKFIRNYLDLDEQMYDVATLFIFQSWLVPVMNSVFYLQIKGVFGGGKTTSGTTIASLCRHGYTSSNVTAPSVARSLEHRQGTVFIDEIDQTARDDEDSLYNVLRIGQKKVGGADVYERVMKDGKVRRFRVFGAKIFAVHSQIESALAQRSIPLTIYPTKKKNLAITNMYRDAPARIVRTKILAWYLQNGLIYLDRMKHSGISEIDGHFFFLSEYSRRAFEMTKRIYELFGLSARNTEITQLMSLVSEIIGVNVEGAMKEIIVSKMKEDEELRETGQLEVLRDVVIWWYERLVDDYGETFRNVDGYISIPSSFLFKSFNTRLKHMGFNTLNNHRFRGYLRELQIDDEESYKKIRLPMLSKEGASSRRTLKRALIMNEGTCKIFGLEVDKGERTKISDFEGQ